MEILGVTIFCDDIRFEQHNKITLVGCYGPEMLCLGDLPIILPKLGMFVQLRLPPGSASPSKIKIYFPGVEDDNPAITVDIGVPSAENIEKSQKPSSDDTIQILGTNVPILLGPIAIIAEGLIRVRVDCGDKVIKAGTLKVTRAASPSPISATVPPPLS